MIGVNPVTDAVTVRGSDTVVSVGSVETVGGFNPPQNKAGATICF
jgi:hypothetical protein